MTKLFEHLKDLAKKLFTLKDSPHAIAGGVAIGILVGFTPLFGVKTLLSLGLAYALHCNPIAAVIAVSLHDVVLPFVPFLLRMEYDIGYWLLSNPHHLPPPLELSRKHFHWEHFLQWTSFFKIGLPVLLGSLFLSVPLSVLSYFFMMGLMKLKGGKAPNPPG